MFIPTWPSLFPSSWSLCTSWWSQPDLLVLLVGREDLLEHELCPLAGSHQGPLQVVQVHPLVLQGPVDVPQPKVNQAQPYQVPSFNKDIVSGEVTLDEVVGMEDAGDLSDLACEWGQPSVWVAITWSHCYNKGVLNLSLPPALDVLYGCPLKPKGRL